MSAISLSPRTVTWNCGTCTCEGWDLLAKTDSSLYTISLIQINKIAMFLQKKNNKMYAQICPRNNPPTF